MDADTRARGYVATDIATNKFLYFVDVDRVNFELFSDDILESTTEIDENIDRLADYSSTNEMDFILIITRENSNTSNGRRRFWGSEYNQGPCRPDGTALLYQDYYVLGVRVRHELVLGNNGEELIEPCGMR